MQTDRDEPELLISWLTPAGNGAIAVLRVWARRAIDATDQIFRQYRGKPLRDSQPGRLRLGRLGAGLGDEVLALVVSRVPPRVEIHCHGGPAARALVTQAFVELGAKILSPEHAGTAADGTAADTHRIRACAEIDLAAAKTLRTAEILLDQTQGAFDNELKHIQISIKHDQSAAVAGLRALIDRGGVGTRLIRGWRIVLAGRPNVGKSMLLNVLAGYTRAIVDQAPGTTRDIVTVETAIDGWPVQIADTAGLRPTDDPIEAVGVELARERQRTADLVVLVTDRSEPLCPIDNELIREYHSALVVANKADLNAAWEPHQDWLIVSAQSAQGVDQLIAAISQRIVPTPPEPGAGVPFRTEHLQMLMKAYEHLIHQKPDSAEATIQDLLVT